MSDYSISAMTPAAIAMENQVSSLDTVQDNLSTIASGVNPEGIDAQEQTVVGAEVASRTQDYMGAGTDLSSTGTDIDIAQTINTSILDGMGGVTDKIV